MKQIKFSIIFGIICATVAVSLNAQSVLKTKSISIFKDGKSFVIKEGSVPAKDREYMLDKIPNALMGTFWFSGKNSYIKQVVSSQQQIDEPVERKANSFSDLLFANKDKEIVITTNDGKTYSGVVEDFDLPEEINSYLQLKEAELSEYYAAPRGGSFVIYNPATQVFSFKMNNKWISLSPMEIKSIEFTTKPDYMVKSKIKVKKPVIKIEFEKGGNQGLNMMYLQDGISWTPTYLLTLLSDTEANLKLQAEVINDVEDIKDTEINFVVGTPNFKYANQPATLNTWTQMAQRLSSSSGYDSKFSNQMVSAKVYRESADYAMEAPAFNQNNEAEENEDFYLYNIKDINLDKGARAHFPLFESKVKIKHMYECSLSTMNKNRDRYDDDEDESYSFDAKYNNVYHSIEILNDTKNPFTTGPVMIVNGVTDKPVAQDLLKYAGTGLTTSIKLTQSSDIRVEDKEKVKQISNNYIKIDDSKYKIATVQGEVVIINSKNKDLNFSLSKTVIGKLNSVSEKYVVTSRIKRNDVNQSESFNIKMVLKGKETKKVTYTYQIYVR
ncbi:MAG: hypothetical protein FWF73_07055 [Spirochaetes bacterium]|nr:hypothetical protein [Spirochaetota bacterium]